MVNANQNFRIILISHFDSFVTIDFQDCLSESLLNKVDTNDMSCWYICPFSLWTQSKMCQENDFLYTFWDRPFKYFNTLNTYQHPREFRCIWTHLTHNVFKCFILFKKCLKFSKHVHCNPFQSAAPHLFLFSHCSDVIISTMASQITSLTIVYSTIYSSADQWKYQSSASLAFGWGIHQ